MKEFFTILGTIIFYGILMPTILGGGSVNGYKIKGILNIIVDFFHSMM